MNFYKGIYKFEQNKAYTFKYKTNTTLWINDVSDQAKSIFQFESTVQISNSGKCAYLLRLSNSKLTGDSLDASLSSLQNLDNLAAEFVLSAEGELDSTVKFEKGADSWSRNLKRAIISAFQTKSEQKLRELEPMSAKKSSVFYETDVLGRCRTTYTKNGEVLLKKKSLHTCTLDSNKKSMSYVNFVGYKSSAVGIL